MTTTSPGFAQWIADIEARHLSDMTPTEVARALRALSSTYVERRSRLSGRGAFDTAGKRAAYALYYAPRRYLTVAHVLTQLAADHEPRAIVDVGCGTGAAGAAWAVHAGSTSSVVGLDAHPWALEETRATWRAFGLHGEVRRLQAVGPRDDMAWLQRASSGRGPAPAFVLSYFVNELDDDARGRLLPLLIAAAGRGARVLVMEPLSRRTSPWWPRWADAVTAAGGRADEWRVALNVPDITKALGRAAGLEFRESTGRTLWL